MSARSVAAAAAKAKAKAKPQPSKASPRRAPKPAAAPPPAPEPWIWEAPARELARIIGAVGIAASSDKSRPILCGIHLHSDGGQDLVIEATDSYRVHRVTTLSPSRQPVDVIIPATMLTRWAKLRHGTGGASITVPPADTTGRRRITITEDLDQWSTLEIGGQYPNVAGLLEQYGSRPNVPTAAVAFNPHYFGGVLKAAHAFGLDTALRMSCPDGLAPSTFHVVGPDGRLDLMLMPLRVPGAAA